jgi:hypothetical protein
MPTDPADYDPKPFLCQVCEWVLGESYREPNQRITQLRVYRVTRPPDWPLLISITDWPDNKIYSVTQMNDGTVICCHCGNKQNWYANQTAIAEMLERRYATKLRID